MSTNMTGAVVDHERLLEHLVLVGLSMQNAGMSQESLYGLYVATGIIQMIVDAGDAPLVDTIDGEAIVLMGHDALEMMREAMMLRKMTEPLTFE